MATGEWRSTFLFAIRRSPLGESGINLEQKKSDWGISPMTAILTNLRNTVIAGFVLAFVAFLIYVSMAEFNNYVFWPFLTRWLHIMSGVMWIGLLWYFNFVQTPTMPKIPDEQKPAVSKVIAPTALFWFRWGAMATIITGLLLAWMNGYIGQALSFQRPVTAI